jgi:AcrR family transcriptional regulator
MASKAPKRIPVQARAVETRDRILRAASDLFSERGYSGTSIAEICDRAGVVGPAIYWHFGSKEGLLSAVIDSSAEEWITIIRNRVLATELELGERLDTLLNAWREIVEQRPNLLRLPFLIMLEGGPISADAVEAVRRLHERSKAEMIAGLTETLGREIPDADLLAEAAIAFLFQALVQRIESDGKAPQPRFWDFMRRMIVIMVIDRLMQSA